MMVSPLGGFFLVVGASLLTAARAVLSDPNHISCDRSNPKIDSNGSCVLSPPCGSRRPGSPVPQTYLCQAVTGWSLSITCSLCPEPADWFRNATQKLSDKPSKTLTLNATEVSPGCYTCQCRDYTCEEDMAFYVAVEPGSKPEFNASCDTDPYNSTQCYFHPSRETVSLHRNESGIICLDGQATAYPVPQYRWEYEDQHGVLHSIGTDLCLNHKDGSDNSTLCITPSLKNTSTRKYRCVVWNEVGTMVGVRNIKLNIRDWVLHDHPDMTSGTVYLINGSATGKMAVYDDCSDQSCYITYASCLLEEDNKDIAEHKDLSCYLSHPNKIKDLYMSCCSCESTCTGYAKTFHSLNIPGDGIASSSECSFSTATPYEIVL